MSRDLKEYEKQTNRRLIIGAVVLLLVVGVGLIWLIYGGVGDNAEGEAGAQFEVVVKIAAGEDDRGGRSAVAQALEPVAGGVTLLDLTGRVLGVEQPALFDGEQEDEAVDQGRNNP